MTYLELARQLAEINKKILKFSEFQKVADTNRGEGVLLSYLARHGQEATPAQLSAALGVSTARIAVLLNKLERKQLVARYKHPNNHRNTIVQLLPAGKELHEQQQEAFNQQVVRFLETLGADRAALFVEFQREMVDYMTKNQEGEHRSE